MTMKASDEFLPISKKDFLLILIIIWQKFLNNAKNFYFNWQKNQEILCLPYVLAPGFLKCRVHAMSTFLILNLLFFEKIEI